MRHVSCHRIVARHGLVSTLNDYDILLRSQHVHYCGFREGSDDVEIDGSPFSSVLSLALDGYGGATEIIELALGSSKLANVGGRG